MYTHYGRVSAIPTSRIYRLSDVSSGCGSSLKMKSTTAQKTITELTKLFSLYGLPQQVVTDNGPQFMASEFDTFMKQKAPSIFVWHTTTLH